jgi:hypothetical protein
MTRPLSLSLSLSLSLPLSLLLSLSLSLPQTALAQTAPPDDQEGKREFAKGSDRLRDGAYEEALAAFVASNRALPSPNTTLLIARCLRELGRLEEAVDRFQAAAVDADARVAAGETRYQQAADSARTEGAALRANLGVLHLRLVGAADVTDVEVDARRAPVRADRTADVLHRPGDVHYRLLDGETLRAEGHATVSAGRWTSIDVVVPSKSAPAPPVDVASGSPRPGWLLPAAISATAVGLLGFGSFTFFGLESQSTFDDLHARCAPMCGPTDRDAPTRGDREQTIANVSLVVGIVALGAGITLGVLALTHSPKAPATTTGAVTPR